MLTEYLALAENTGVRSISACTVGQREWIPHWYILVLKQTVPPL